uniref:Uncharacterized protein n=1 Tax=Rhizophora mucronata TaxID=61149 RepID=A0A2P2J1A1_RHIMU
MKSHGMNCSRENQYTTLQRG